MDGRGFQTTNATKVAAARTTTAQSVHRFQVREILEPTAAFKSRGRITQKLTLLASPGQPHPPRKTYTPFTKFPGGPDASFTFLRSLFPAPIFFTHMHRTDSFLEPLEARIAPASLVYISNGGKIASWIDVDGDHVTVTATKAIFAEADFTFLPQETGDLGSQLALLDLHTKGTGFNGVGLKFTATRNRIFHAGDGSVNIGRIDATGLDLGAVSIPGDLTSISAGDASLTTSAIASLTVRSGGAFGLDTQGAEVNGVATNNEWIFTGKTGAIRVQGNLSSSIDVNNGNDTIDFDLQASLASVTINGELVGGDDSLRGGDGVGSGYIFTEGPLGPVKISGNVIGGSAAFGGSITSSSSIASITVGGNVVGGTATGTGLLFSYGPLGKVTITGSLVGGNSVRAVDGTLPVVIDSAGSIGTSWSMDAVKIGGDVSPGIGTFSGAIYTTPDTHANIKSVTIGGTLYGFDSIITDTTQGTVQHVVNGIYSDAKLGAVKVGAIAGTSPSAYAQIIARGKPTPTSAADALAIASVTVVRGVYAGEILAGFGYAATADNPEVQIGPVKIGNDFVASSISAGMSNADHGFGGPNNALAPESDTYKRIAFIYTKIASVTIGGTVSGNPLRTADFNNGIVAQQIGSVKIGGAVLELTSNPDALAVGVTPGFYVREIL